MEYVWAGERKQENSSLYFYLDINKKCDKIIISAVDFFQVFIDDKLACFGPDRAPAGYSRIKELRLNRPKKLEIYVVAYNIDTYCCDRQLPFFGAEIYDGNRIVYNTTDFVCFKNYTRIKNMPRYSYQRGFVEGYDFTVRNDEELSYYGVDAPILLNGSSEKADYSKIAFEFINSGIFAGFDSAKTPWWEKASMLATPNHFNVETEIVKGCKGWFFCDYILSYERTGFIELDIDALEDTQIYAVFEEYLPNGKWCFRRSNCNDFISVKVCKGKRTFFSFEPYAFKFLKLLFNKNIKITPYLRTYENVYVNSVYVSGNKQIVNVFNAARNTFCQNAVDLFTDCPGRERAGWLCDSYFTAKAERLFTGKNEIEKNFLQNFLLSHTPEIEDGMLPMCFPAEHPDGKYIPNWAMWFAIEICDYYARTKDKAFIDKAKYRIYAIIDFFNQFTNEYGLLENLRSWVFLEWSVANDSEYIKGVNFPTNMLYAFALQKIGELYSDNELLRRAEKMRTIITERSFNGEFFIDNETRENNILKLCENHVSETCQYYALFTGLSPSKDFEWKMIKEFGPLRTDKFLNIGRSNMFIGNYLRFFWLLDKGENDRVINESLEYFSQMAEKTGTLWENDQATCSCNHGFASVAAVLLLRALTGYVTTENGVPTFGDKIHLLKKYNSTITFVCDDGREIVKNC